MRFRAFGEKHIGHGHVKRNMGCEDYALSYNDPQKRFFIGAACDGHSDNNCFRSAAGARFGCESAIEVLRKLFELYYMQPAESRDGSRINPDRACRAIKQLWDRKVMADIRDNPLQDHELAPLTEKVRNYYLAGNGLNNIYGATFLAVAVCEDFFLAFHVGDGIILCIGKDGRYYEPVTEDPRSQTGAPASLCDSDLFTRDRAFRYVLTRELPMAAVVSSDGIQDCLDDLQYIRFVHDFFAKIMESELPEQMQDELNDEQKAFLMDRLAYYAGQGHGAEDDCSFAGFYDLDQEVPDIRISNEIIARKWDATVKEREHVIRDYEERKNRMVRTVREQERSLEQYYEDYQRAGRSLNIFGDRRKPAAAKCKEAFEKLDELVGICFTIDDNERAKGRYFDARLESLRKLSQQPDQLPGLQLTPISQAGLSDHAARRRAAEEVRKARTALAEARKAEEEADQNFKAAMDHNVAASADQTASGQGVDLGAYAKALQDAKEHTLQAQNALAESEAEYRETIPEKYREILKLLESGSLPDPPADDTTRGYAPAGTDSRAGGSYGGAKADSYDPYDSYVTGKPGGTGQTQAPRDIFDRPDPSQGVGTGRTAGGASSGVGDGAAGAAAGVGAGTGTAGTTAGAGIGQSAGQSDRHPLDPPDSSLKPRTDRTRSGQAGGPSGYQTGSRQGQDPYNRQQGNSAYQDPYRRQQGNSAYQDPYRRQAGDRAYQDSHGNQADSRTPDPFRYKQVNRNRLFANEDEFQK